jgi:hypothetical protein
VNGHRCVVLLDFDSASTLPEEIRFRHGEISFGRRAVLNDRGSRAAMLARAGAPAAPRRRGRSHCFLMAILPSVELT